MHVVNEEVNRKIYLIVAKNFTSNKLFSRVFYEEGKVFIGLWCDRQEKVGNLEILVILEKELISCWNSCISG